MVSLGQDFTVFRKQDDAIQFTIEEDVTGWTLEWVVREGDGTGAIVAALTTVTAGMTVTPGATSTIVVPLSDTQLDIEVGTYWHALRRTNAGLEKPLSTGKLQVLAWAYAT